MRTEPERLAAPGASRWPRSVYDHGEEPDPRFTLANERTLLAGLRTALALLAGAAAVASLDLGMPGPVARTLGVVLTLMGITCSVQAWRGWMRTERAIRLNTPLPANPVNAIVVVGIVLVGLILLGVAVWTNR